MNVTPSKILLALSLAAYVWCSWDNLSISKFSDAPATIPVKEHKPTSVGRKVKLELAGDPFFSIPLPWNGSSGAAAGSFGGNNGDPEKPAGDLSLHGTLTTPGQRLAIINGKALYEGERSALENGASIRVRKVGADYAVVECATGVLMLRLDDPKEPKTKLPGKESAIARQGQAEHATEHQSSGHRAASGGRLASIRPEER
jgi:hypothetical protein